MDIIPDTVERSGILASKVANVGNWLRNVAYIGDAVPIPVIGDVAGAGAALLASSCDAVANLMDGGSLADTFEIAVAGAAEAAVFAIPGDVILLDQIQAAGRYFGIEALDLPGLARYGVSRAFNAATGRDTSAIYAPKEQGLVQAELIEEAPKTELLSDKGEVIQTLPPAGYLPKP